MVNRHLNELRSAFVELFNTRGFTESPSSTLIPPFGEAFFSDSPFPNDSDDRIALAHKVIRLTNLEVVRSFEVVEKRTKRFEFLGLHSRHLQERYIRCITPFATPRYDGSVSPKFIL